MNQEKALTLKTLTKSSIWDIQENDIFRMWKSVERDADVKENYRHYLDIIRTAFEIEELKIDKPEVIKKYEARGFKVGKLKTGEKDSRKWAIKKRPISHVTDLTYENIRHISASKLLEVINGNFGGGWDSLPQRIKDIIMSGFDISTSTLPQNRLHNPGGIYEKKLADDFEVLEIVKGTWVEVIFAKAKPVIEKNSSEKMLSEKRKKRISDDEDDDLDFKNLRNNDDYYSKDDYEDDDIFDDDELTEESYRTTYDTDPEDLSLDDIAAAEEDY
jgi:hypothetical protein